MYRQTVYFSVKMTVITEFLIPKAHLSLTEIADSGV
jgi:hypothetical protein